MEKEIADLRRRLASGEHPQPGEANASDELSQCSEDVFCSPDATVGIKGRPLSAPLDPQPIATPLTIHRDASILSQDDNPWILEDVSLSRARVARLFDQYDSLPVHAVASWTKLLMIGKVFQILSSLSSSFESTEAPRRIYASLSIAGMDDHLCC